MPLPAIPPAIWWLLSALGGTAAASSIAKDWVETGPEKAKRKAEKEARTEENLANAMLSVGEARRGAAEAGERRVARKSQENLYRESLRNQAQMALMSSLASMMQGQTANEMAPFESQPSMYEMGASSQNAAQQGLNRIMAGASAQPGGNWSDIYT